MICTICRRPRHEESTINGVTFVACVEMPANDTFWSFPRGVRYCDCCRCDRAQTSGELTASENEQKALWFLRLPEITRVQRLSGAANFLHESYHPSKQCPCGTFVCLECTDEELIDVWIHNHFPHHPILSRPC